MNVLFASNNRNGYLVGQALKRKNARVEALLLQKTGARYTDEIRTLFPEAQVFTKKLLTPSKIRELGISLLLSANYGFRIPAECLQAVDLAVNLHISYLPYNGGANPNVWGIVDGTPQGVTLHMMRAEIDEGDILFQKEIETDLSDDARDIYEKLEKTGVELIEAHFDDLVSGNFQPRSFDLKSYHAVSEFDRLKIIDPDEKQTFMHWLNRLRALTFPPYRNCRIEVNGKTFNVEVKVTRID